MEGGSVPLVFPGAAMLAAALVWRWHLRRPMGPTQTMFLAAHVLALVLLVIWGLWHTGFPQFTELGSDTSRLPEPWKTRRCALYNT